MEILEMHLKDLTEAGPTLSPTNQSYQYFVRGKSVNKPRVKIVETRQMLYISINIGFSNPATFEPLSFNLAPQHNKIHRTV